MPSKKQRCVKTKAQDVILSLGKDIQWGDTMDTADRVLVGIVWGRNYIAAQLRQWTVEVWGQHLPEIPFVQTFIKSWFALSFARVKHKN